LQHCSGGVGFSKKESTFYFMTKRQSKFVAVVVVVVVVSSIRQFCRFVRPSMMCSQGQTMDTSAGREERRTHEKQEKGEVRLPLTFAWIYRRMKRKNEARLIFVSKIVRQVVQYMVTEKGVKEKDCIPW
jgi:hypothetical protein